MLNLLLPYRFAFDTVLLKVQKKNPPLHFLLKTHTLNNNCECQKSKSLSTCLVEHAENHMLSYQCEHDRGVDKERRKGREGQSEGATLGVSHCRALQGTER